MLNSLLDLFRSAPKPRPTSIFPRPGVYALSGKFVETVSGGDAFASHQGFFKAITNRKSVKGLRQTLGPSYIWDMDIIKTAQKDFKNTGVLPVFVSRSVPASELESVIRHEQIHAAHFMNPEHPFFAHALENTKPLNRILKEGEPGEEFLTRTRKLYANIFKESRKVSRESAKLAINSERLAYTFMHDESFLQGAEAVGIKTHLSLESMVKGSHTAPGRSKSLIQGLRDSGMACRIRNVLTKFGSGWQGLTFKYHVEEGELIHKHEVQVFQGETKVGWASALQESGSKTFMIDEIELAHSMRGQGVGKQMYKALFGMAKKAGGESVVSGGVVSEEAQRVWRSAQKSHLPVSEGVSAAGPTFKLDLSKYTSRVMDAGEGAAIARAGTAEVPSILKATSRIIRSAL